MPVQGDFDAVDFLSVLNANKPSRTLTTLKNDGFVKGYGRSWAGNRSNQLLLEVVVAFGGGVGAKRWLPEARSLDQNSQYYKNSFTMPGIDTQFGNHFVNSAGPAYADSAGFVKGNDYFFVYMFSQKDDLADAVAKQARQQYDLAPANTIPPSQWPENASQNAASNLAGAFAPSLVFVLVVVLVLVVIAAAVVVLVRRGSRRPAPVPMSGALQMSPDGNYWWDGQAWRDASQAAPPSAQRSADGYYWWDGSKWRAAPRAPS